MGLGSEASASRTSMRLTESGPGPKFVRCNSYSRWRRPSLGNAVGANGTRISSWRGKGGILFTYVCADAYLRQSGKLGFVITQTLFKSKGGGQGFRRFRIGDQEYLGVTHVDDMSDLQPFEEAANRTAVLSLEKGLQTHYPVRYSVWLKKDSSSFVEDSELQHVLEATARQEMLAFTIDPSDATSPWITGPAGTLAVLVPKIRASEYVARMGAHFGASGVFWVRILSQQKAGRLLVENTGGGKKKVPSRSSVIEDDLVFPLIRGRDMSRWSFKPVLGVIMVQDQSNLSRPMPLKILRRQHPLTYQHLAEFEDLLRNCAILDQFFDAGVDPFYSTYQVGPYTFAASKVIWRQVADELDACVALQSEIDGLARKPCIPADSLCSIAATSEDEAHYICAMLNSSISRYIIKSYVSLHPSPHILEYLNIRKWNPAEKAFIKLAGLSRECHDAAGKGKRDHVADFETEIDEVAASLWGITGHQLGAIQGALAETDREKLVRPDGDADAD